MDEYDIEEFDISDYDIEDEELINFINDDKYWNKIEKELTKENEKLWLDIWGAFVAAGYFEARDQEIAQIMADSRIIAHLKDNSNDAALRYFNIHGGELIKSLSKSDIKEFKKIMVENWGKAPYDISAKFKDSFYISEKRLYSIGRTEYHTAFENSRWEVAGEMEKISDKRTRKIHHHSGNPNPRIEHLQADGEVREYDEYFSYGQDYPAEPNCTCWVEYEYY